jgi:hypothetical protein
MAVTLTDIFNGISESLGLVLPDIEDDAGAIFLRPHALNGILLLLRDTVLDESPCEIDRGLATTRRVKGHLQGRLLLLAREQRAVDECRFIVPGKICEACLQCLVLVSVESLCDLLAGVGEKVKDGVAHIV